MRKTIFYSWQSTSDRIVNRDLIRRALEAAVVKLDRSFELDEGAEGLPGSPPIFETIQRKIISCHLFVADLSLVVGTSDTKLSSNPNVLIEYGFALARRGHSRVILVINRHFGSADRLPFDVRHYEVVSYELRPAASTSEIEAEEMSLRNQLYVKLRASLADPESALSLSNAEATVASFLARSAKTGFADGLFDAEEIAEASGLTIEDAREALEELSSRGYVKKHPTMQKSFFERAPKLYVDLDVFVHGWDPRLDAREMALEIRQVGKLIVEEYRERKQWTIRQVNAATQFLLEEGVAKGAGNVESSLAATVLFENDLTRSFVRETAAE